MMSRMKLDGPVGGSGIGGVISILVCRRPAPMRARQVSRPSTSSVPKSGGAVLRPQTATRIGSNIWPALIPSYVGRAAQRRLQPIVGELGGRERPRAPARGPARAIAASPFLGDQLGAHRKAAVRRAKKKSATVSTSRSSLMRSWISGVICMHFLRCRRRNQSAHERAAASSASSSAGMVADVLGIQPERLRVERIVLGEVDDGVAAIDAFEREDVRSVPAATVARGRPWAIPAEQAEEIDERVRQEAGVAICRDADDRAVLALRELRPVGRHRAAAGARTPAASTPSASKISMCLNVFER